MKKKDFKDLLKSIKQAQKIALKRKTIDQYKIILDRVLLFTGKLTDNPDYVIDHKNKTIILNSEKFIRIKK